MKLQARIENASTDAKSGDSLLTLRISDTKILKLLPMLEGKELTVDIKDGQKRSLSANAYAWVLIDRLAQKTGLPKREIYRQTIREVGGVSETVCVQKKAAETLKTVWEKNGDGWQAIEEPSKIKGCVNMVLYYGSSCYTTKQMNRLINLLQDEAVLMGLNIATPAEVANMLSLWGEAR